MPLWTNLILVAGYPHLLLHNQCITQHLQACLWDAATQQTYFDYLTEKFLWQQDPGQAIQWPIICTTLNHFNATDHHIITKFIQQWLPLQDWYHMQSNSTDQLCPSCGQSAKTVEHFLACSHTNWQQIWKELHDSLHKHQIQNSISNIFHDILAFGLYQGHQAPMDLEFHHLPHDLTELYHRQESLGWKQLYYGHLTPLWIHLLGHYHPQINGWTYFTKVNMLIWKAVLQVWKLQNSHLHPSSHKQEDCSYLQAAVNQFCYEAQQDPYLHRLVEHLDPAQILSHPTCRIWQWVQYSNNHMHAYIKNTETSSSITYQRYLPLLPQVQSPTHLHING